MGVVINKRLRLYDRRQNKETLSFSLKVSNGVTIKECRRKIPDRRINDIQVEWIDETVVD